MKVAVIGYGTVGSGVVEVLLRNHDTIVRRNSLDELELKYILDIRDFPLDPNKEKFTKDFNDILNDEEVGVVVETMGGIHPAFEFTSQLLSKGKSVVTSNKELVAQKGFELLNLAKENKANYMFEASVGGGIPIIRPINNCLSANEIIEIAGILNGTTNYILTKMINDGMSMDEALMRAQQKGYAEKDPTADIEGIDAGRKICILADLAFGKHVFPDQVYTQGIRDITLEDVEFVKDFGGVIKLIGSAKRIPDGRICAQVRPSVILKNSQLATTSGVFNAILVRGNALGDAVFYGRGAGKLPTASAVVADVIDCARHQGKTKILPWGENEKDFVAPNDLISARFYVRAYNVNDGSLAELDRLLGNIRVLERKNQSPDEFAFVTEEIVEKDLREKLGKIGSVEIKSLIPVTDY
ncbi:MAG: homoserine dehydrogenase [Ruminococcaceae bacterium]|jgi:homoserine dehydrogenase|nr:homoserine dehydrogenase [Oscillospiraceae bacterium]